MRWIGSTTLVFVVGVSVAQASRELQDEPITPAEQYRLLLEERDRLPDELASAMTGEESRQMRERLTSLPQRFLELAESNPEDPIALEALIQTVALVNGTAFPVCGNDTPGDRALSLLVRDHVQSDKLGQVCQQVITGFHRGPETFLRAVVASNPHREIQGLACLSLAQFLNDRVHRLAVLDDQDEPDVAERYRRVFGKDLLEELQRQDRALVAEEAETLFARAAERFSASKVRQVMVEKNLNWRSFVDQGAIAETWKPAGTPAFYIIDHGGVIRYKWAGAPGAKAMDAALERVIREAEQDAKKPPK